MNDAKKIAVIGGDGTGPEVAAKASRCSRQSRDRRHQVRAERVRFRRRPLLQTGECCPPRASTSCASSTRSTRRRRPSRRRARHPGRSCCWNCRFGLDQYINLRPVKLFPGVETPLKDKGPDDIDFVVVRENTEDMYCGVGGFLHKNTPHEVATQTAIYTRRGCERCIRWAFELTRKRNNPKGRSSRWWPRPTC